MRRSIDVTERAYVRKLIQVIRAAIEAAPEGQSPNICVGPCDIDVLTRVLDAACRASPRIHKHDAFFKPAALAPTPGAPHDR